MNQEAMIERVRGFVKESSKIVVLLGVGTVIESGGENFWSSENATVSKIYTTSHLMRCGQ